MKCSIFDPLGRKSWRVAGYSLLATFFARLAIWHATEQRWGRA